MTIIFCSRDDCKYCFDSECQRIEIVLRIDEQNPGALHCASMEKKRGKT